MPRPNKPDRAESWLTRAQMAAIFDVSLSYFDRALRPLFESKRLVRYRANRPLFHARGCIEEWSQLQRRQRQAGQLDNDELDYLVLAENLQP